MYIWNQWYWLATVDEVEKQNPLPKKILGQDIVLFKTETGQIAVVENRCCHRNVALSLGYVKGEILKCAYHGWEYNAAGKCTHIPSLAADSPISKAACVKSYATKILNGIVWVFMGEIEKSQTTPLPFIPEIDDLPWIHNYHTLNGNLPLVAESLIDPYHIDHVHRNSIKTFMGNLHRDSVNFELNLSNNSLTGSYQRENTGNFFEKFYFGKKDFIHVNFAFYFPHTSKLHIAFEKRDLFIYEHFYPIENDQILMIQITAWSHIFDRMPLTIAKKLMLQKSNEIVEEDLDFLASNHYYTKKMGVNDMLIKPDKVSIAFAELWKKCTSIENENKSMNPINSAS